VKYLEVADLTSSESEHAESASVAAALAVLAGIAAADVACCAALGRRARGQDHREAVDLLAQVLPGGREAASDLRRLLDVKDTAEYGLIHVSATRVRSSLAQAGRLVEFAKRTLRR
jgi:hypothetical protein